MRSASASSIARSLCTARRNESVSQAQRAKKAFAARHALLLGGEYLAVGACVAGRAERAALDVGDLGLSACDVGLESGEAAGAFGVRTLECLDGACVPFGLGAAVVEQLHHRVDWRVGRGARVRWRCVEAGHQWNSEEMDAARSKASLRERRESASPLKQTFMSSKPINTTRRDRRRFTDAPKSAGKKRKAEGHRAACSRSVRRRRRASSRPRRPRRRSQFFASQPEGGLVRQEVLEQQVGATMGEHVFGAGLNKLMGEGRLSPRSAPT